MSVNRDRKREDGAKRNAAWAALSPVEQLRELDRRLGKGVGATRQRTKLTSVLDAPKASAVPQAAEVLPAATFKKGKK